MSPRSELRLECVFCESGTTFSLLTLVEHLATHLRRQCDEIFQFKCMDCHLFFVTRPAMTKHRHKRPDHRIINLPLDPFMVDEELIRKMKHAEKLFRKGCRIAESDVDSGQQKELALNNRKQGSSAGEKTNDSTRKDVSTKPTEAKKRVDSGSSSADDEHDRGRPLQKRKRFQERRTPSSKKTSRSSDSSDPRNSPRNGQKRQQVSMICEQPTRMSEDFGNDYANSTHQPLETNNVYYSQSHIPNNNGMYRAGSQGEWNRRRTDPGSRSSRQPFDWYYGWRNSGSRLDETRRTGRGSDNDPHGFSD